MGRRLFFSGMTQKTFKKLLAAMPAGGGAGAPPVFRITSTNKDRHDDRVLAIKAAGDSFKAPLLWNHDSWRPAIGAALCKREAGEWVMTPVFDEACDTSKMVAAKVKAGTLDACSIRFRPAPEAEPVPNKEGGYDFPLVEVLEVSIVNIPANQDAVRLRSADGEAPPDDEDGGWAEYRTDGMAFRSEVRSRLVVIEESLAKLLPPAEGGDEEAKDGEETTPDEGPEKDEETAPDEDPEKDEEPTEDEEPASAADEAEEGTKAMRRAVIKGFGFTPAQAAALPLPELVAYVDLLPTKSTSTPAKRSPKATKGKPTPAPRKPSK